MRSGASVNAVTKSGTNNFHGNLFEFLRDKRFNATSRFAPIGPDGKRKDDGLSRHQFGGTFGGPIVRDRLFFFGGYQGTYLNQAPNDNVAYVPTAAMLAGDFTAFASPACNNGRQIVLRPPFVNNQIDPRSSVRRRSTLPDGSPPRPIRAATIGSRLAGQGPSATRARSSPRSTTSGLPTTRSSAAIW